jgi:replication factor C small subunit
LEPVLWSVKYRPRQWEDFYGQEHAVQLLREFSSSQNFPNIILYGPHGTGKTSAAQLYAREILGDLFTANFKHLNIRDIRQYSTAKAKRDISALAKLDRSERTEFDEYMSVVFREAAARRKSQGRSGDPNRSELLHEAIRMFASTMSVANDLVKVLVLDEADALDNNMQQALRRTMERYAPLCRFILATSSLSGWNPAIISRCIVINFSRPSQDAVTSLLSHIADTESVLIDELGLAAIAKESSGDFRRAINLLQICYSTGKPITEDIVYAHSETPLTGGVRKMISYALSGQYLPARDLLRSLLTYEQYTPDEVCLQMEREVLKRPFPADVQMRLLDRIATIDHRMTQAKNPHIHLAALLASIWNLGKVEEVVQ